MAQATTEEQLFKIFANVNDWLKFSETKNAMLIAFNSGSIYGMVQAAQILHLRNYHWLEVYLMISIIILVASTIVALISFVPRVRMVEGGLFGPASDSNILFFEYLRTKTTIDILKEVSGTDDEKTFSKIERDIAEQIRQNSIIASRKFSYFTIAVWLTVTAYVSIPFAIFLALYSHFKD